MFSNNFSKIDIMKPLKKIDYAEKKIFFFLFFFMLLKENL